MEHCGLTKDDKDALFESLQLLNRLTEDCFASDATDSNTCHHYSDAQTAETAPSSVRRQTTQHGATADAIPNERAPTSRAAPMPNARVTARVDLMAKSLDHHDVIPLSFHQTVTRTNDCIQNTVSTRSAKRHINDRFIASATNGCQTTRVSKR